MGALFLLTAVASGVYALSGPTLGTFETTATQKPKSNGISYEASIPSNEISLGHRFLEVRMIGTLSTGQRITLCQVRRAVTDVACFAAKSLNVVTAVVDVLYADGLTGNTAPGQSPLIRTLEVVNSADHQLSFVTTVQKRPGDNGNGNSNGNVSQDSGAGVTDQIAHAQGVQVRVVAAR
jgi:hypothetical protein